MDADLWERCLPSRDMEGWQQIAGIWEEAETDCPSQALDGASATYCLILDVCLKNCETMGVCG